MSAEPTGIAALSGVDCVKPGLTKTEACISVTPKLGLSRPLTDGAFPASVATLASLGEQSR